MQAIRHSAWRRGPEVAREVAREDARTQPHKAKGLPIPGYPFEITSGAREGT